MEVNWHQGFETNCQRPSSATQFACLEAKEHASLEPIGAAAMPEFRYATPKRICFMDETWFELFVLECLIETVKHPRKVMCWGGISATGKTALIFINRNVDVEKYIEALGQAKLPNFLCRHPLLCPPLMEDGALAHQSQLMKQWYAEREIQVLEG